MRKTYPTDLSDAQWSCLLSYLPAPKAQGRPRIHSLRDVLDAIFYVLKSGCHWRLLPHDFPPWPTVYYHFRRFRSSGLWSLILKALLSAERKRAGKDPQPTAGHYGFPKHQDRRRIGPPERLRRLQERQRTQAAPSGGYPGSSTLGLCHLGRRTR